MHQIDKKVLRDHGTIIIGEQHGDYASTAVLREIIEQKSRAGFKLLTMEEPRDSQWEPVLDFLFDIKKINNNDPKHKIETLLLEQDTLARLTLIALAKSLGMEIAFIDEPSQKKMRRKKNLEKLLTRTPKEKVKEILLEKELKNCRERSKIMAKTIAKIQKGRRLIHIGGRLHISQMADTLERLRGVRPLEIEIVPRNDSEIIKGLMKDFQGERIFL